MKYEPGAMALCIDPTAPKQVVTLMNPEPFYEQPAWLVRFPAPILWSYGPRGLSAEGVVAKRYLILLPGDVEPETVTDDMEVPA